MFSAEVEAALAYASARHAGQTRKCGEVPYFVHLVHVALILAQRGDDAPTLVIALLHDVLEDTTQSGEEQRAVEGEIRARWGDEVVDGVLRLTEPKRDEEGARLGWRDRKKAYIAQLEGASRRACRVSAADKLHNLESLLAALEAEGPVVWSRFRGGPAESRWFYEEVLRVLTARLGPTDELVQALAGAAARLLEAPT